MVFEIEDRIPWKKNEKGLRPSIKDKVLHRNYFPDTISDELVVLRPVSKKQK
jgi:hypothetical protein